MVALEFFLFHFSLSVSPFHVYNRVVFSKEKRGRWCGVLVHGWVIIYHGRIVISVLLFLGCSCFSLSIMIIISYVGRGEPMAPKTKMERNIRTRPMGVKK